MLKISNTCAASSALVLDERSMIDSPVCHCGRTKALGTVIKPRLRNIELMKTFSNDVHSLNLLIDPISSALQTFAIP